MNHVINGFRMNYQDAGDGPPLLLVHGFPLDHTLWIHQIETFKGDYRVILPDLRGHGQSEAPPGPYRMDRMAADLSALLQELKIERVVLGGLSMGGYVVFAFWRLYPERVRALLLANTRAAADTREGKQNRQAMIERVQAAGKDAIVEDLLLKLLSPATLERKPEVVAHARQMMANTPASGVIGALQGMAQRPDSTPTLATITVPTLIIVGEDDTIIPPAEGEAMRSQILSKRDDPAPTVGLVRVPQAGHLAPMENPTAFNQALRGFLATLPD